MSKIEVNEIARRSGSSPIPIPGHVIQTVYGNTSSQSSTSSTSFQNTGLTASITPSSSSSKVLVIVNANVYNGTNGEQCWCTVYRGDNTGTNLGNGTKGIGAAHVSNGNGFKAGISCSIVDSPSTTSAQTYTVAIRSNAGGTAYLNVNSDKSTMILQEIAQ